MLRLDGLILISLPPDLSIYPDMSVLQERESRTMLSSVDAACAVEHWRWPMKVEPFGGFPWLNVRILWMLATESCGLWGLFIET